MKKIILLSLLLSASLLLNGCSTVSDCTIVGTVRPATNPSTIQVYSESGPNTFYVPIAVISASSRRSMQDSITRLKREAAKVGANGLILSWTGSIYGGTVGYSFGSATAYGNAYGATAFGSSTAISSPIYYQCAKGTAIYVQP